MSKIFFTSDNHFSHTNILKHSNRPFFTESDSKLYQAALLSGSLNEFRPSSASVKNMNDEMTYRWNQMVPHDGIVYSLGDFAFCQYEELTSIASKLNGTKIHILGNHDKIIRKNAYKCIKDGLFKSINDFSEVKLEEQRLILCHYGLRVWNKSHFGSWHLYGHSHGTLPPLGKSVDVGVDSPWITGVAEYRPFTFEEIKQFMDNAEINYSDHHLDR